MRELNLIEINAISGGISNLEVVLYPGIAGGAVGAGLSIYGGYGILATVALGTLGFLTCTSIGIALVFGAGIVKFARQDISV